MVRSLPEHPNARAALQAAGSTTPAGYANALATLAARRCWCVHRDVRHSPGRLVDQFELGLDAPICLTWELTYACNLSCVHCLSSSGRRDPRELSTEQCKAVIDELERMQVFYVNIGGGEPTVRADFWELVDYATAAPRRGEVLHQRRADRRGRRGQRLAASRLRRRADLARRCDRGGQRRRARAGLVRDGDPRAGEPVGGRIPRRQDLGGDDPPQRRSAR